MRGILAVAVALMLWALPAWSLTTTAMGPGGGGANNCSATTGLTGGRVLVGTDNSGIYGRNGTSGNWTRIGSFAGLTSNNILSIAFSKNPKYVLAGTGEGLFRSTDTGQTWSVPTLNDSAGISVGWNSNDITAVGWGTDADSQACFVAFQGSYSGANPGNAKDRIFIAISEDRGANFKLCTTSIPWNTWADASQGSRYERVPVKIAGDPLTAGTGDPAGSSRDIFILFGIDNTSSGDVSGRTRYRELWSSQTNGTSFSKVSGGSGPTDPIDFAFYPNGVLGSSRMVVSSSDTTDSEDVATGSLWLFKTASGGTWVQTNPFGGAPSNLTGAVWTDGTYEYLLQVTQSAGPTGSPSPPKCGSINAAAGIWRRPGTVTGGDSCVWYRIDDGNTNGGTTSNPWELGWTSCSRARGKVNSALAKNVSLSGPIGASGDGPYLGSMSFVFRYNGSKFVKEFTDHDQSSPYNTTLLDNANAVTMSEGSIIEDELWVGYYDIGLWKYTGSGWENHNDSDWGWSTGSDAYGGNVNGIVSGGPGMLVTAAPSSKTNAWRLYSSTSGGYNTFSTYGDLPYNGDGTRTGCFLNSFVRDPATQKYWVSVALLTGSTWTQSIYSSTNGSNWSVTHSSLPTSGMVVVRAYNGIVLAGGWGGLYRSTDAGANWAEVTSIDAPIPTSSPAENATTHLHRHLWHGVQDILYDTALGYWYVTCYAPSIGLTDGSKGVWRSVDGGATFSQIQNTNQRRAVLADSCGSRIHIASGTGFSSPVNGSGQFSVPGLETCRWSGSTLNCVTDVANDGVWGYPQAHTLRASADNLSVYALSPGYGVHKVGTFDVGGGMVCTEFHGGDEMGARRAVEEIELPRTLFSVADAQAEVKAGAVTLYDLTGRKVKSPRPGVYFVLNRTKAGVVTSRRTVVVTP